MVCMLVNEWIRIYKNVKMYKNYRTCNIFFAIATFKIKLNTNFWLTKGITKLKKLSKRGKCKFLMDMPKIN